MMIKKNKRRAFTLLELMVCLVIITLLGAFVGIKGVDLIAHHRLHSSLDTFLLDFQKHQILAMTQKADVLCSLKLDGKQVKATFTSESPEFMSSSLELKELSKISFEGKSIFDFNVTLFSSGRIYPQGTLCFVPKNEENPPLFLDLSYPIVFTSKPPSLKKEAVPPYPEKSSS